MEDILLSLKQYRALMDRLNSITHDVGTMRSKTLSQPVVLDNHELRELLQVTARTIRRWRSRGTLPYFWIGSKICYRSEDLLGRFRLRPQSAEVEHPLSDPAISVSSDTLPPAAMEGTTSVGAITCTRCPLFLLFQNRGGERGADEENHAPA